MGSGRASPRAVLIEDVGLTQWRTRGSLGGAPRDGGSAFVAVKCHAVADAQRCAPRVRGEEDGVPIGPLAAPSSAATPADLLRVANVLGTRRAKALAASATLGHVHGMYARRRSPGPRGPRRPPRPTHGRRTLCARLHKRRWQRPQQRRLRAAMTRGAPTRVTGNSRRHRTARRTPGRRIRANPPHPGPHFASGVDVSGSGSRRGVQSGGSSSPRPGVCAGALVTGVRRGLLEQVAGGGCDPCPVDSCPAE
jgi:hypothetical protein